MGRKAIVVLAVAAILVAVLQHTSLAFLSTNERDFAWGLAAGLTFGALVSWFAGAQD